MKATLVFWIALTLSISAFSDRATPQVAELSSLGAGIAVGEAIDKLDDLVRSRIDQAISGADYLLEKAMRETHLLIQNLRFVYREELDYTLESLSYERKQVFYEIEGLIAEGFGELGDLETQTALDFQRLLADLPFTSNEYWIQTIQGSYLAHKESGPYQIVLKGSGFDAGRTTRIWVDGHELSNISSAERQIVRANIPRSIIQEQFRETDVNRLPFRFETTRVKDAPLWLKVLTLSLAKPTTELLYQYEGFIGLLPVRPATYKLVVVEEYMDWSDKLYDIRSKNTRIPGNGKGVKGEDPNQKRNICLEVPEGCKIERGTVQGGCNENDYGKFEGEFSYSNNDRIVCRIHKSWFEHEKLCWVKAKYRKLEKKTQTRHIELCPLSVDQVAEHLSLDIPYTAAVPTGTVRFELVITLFNGEMIRVASDIKEPRVLVTLSREGDRKRITVTLDKSKIFGI